MQAALVANEKASTAAALSAKIASDKQRPLLLLSHLDFGDMGLADFNAKLQSPKIEAIVTNFGGSIAISRAHVLTIVCAEMLPSVECLWGGSHDSIPRCVR